MQWVKQKLIDIILKFGNYTAQVQIQFTLKKTLKNVR